MCSLIADRRLCVDYNFIAFHRQKKSTLIASFNYPLFAAYKICFLAKIDDQSFNVNVHNTDYIIPLNLLLLPDCRK